MAGYLTPSWTNGSSPAIDASELTAMGQGIELGAHPYGVCSTSAASAAKTVTIDFSGTLTLYTGLRVTVKFSNSNTASSPTLNVNSTGAKAIKSYGTTAATTWVAGQAIDFVYDGTNWLFDGIDAYTKNQSLSSATAAAIQALQGGATPSTPDNALALLASAVSAVSSTAQLASGTYTGTGANGSATPNTLTFSFVPKLLFVTGKTTTNKTITLFGINPCTDGLITAMQSGWVHLLNIVSWSGTSVSWWTESGNAVYQLNDSGIVYTYVAIG